MACTTMHMAIGKLYCEKHPEENYKDFMLGSNLPDITNDKNSTHFGNVVKGLLYKDYAIRKINLDKVVENVQLNSSLNRGIFLHLISDYVFFNDVRLKQDPKALKTIYVRDMAPLSDHDYNVLTQKMVDRYGIDLNEVPEYLKQFIREPKDDKLIFYNEEELYNFIEKMSNLNLFEIRDKILNKDYNICDIKWE